MPQIRNMIGLRFGRLVVLERDGLSKGGAYTYKCQCDCGGFVVSSGCNLRSGNTTSCGCYRLEQCVKATTTHGMKHSRIYNIWQGMIMRCENPNNTEWKNYGGRGISVCAEWHDFPTFLADMGEPEYGMSIDRIDNSGNYEKSNCRWASRKEQARNTRATRILTCNGETRCLKEWSEVLKVDYYTLHARVRRGWTDEQVILTPIGNNHS